MRRPLVQVLWLDSADPNGNWVRISVSEEIGELDCVSIGWLIGEDSESIAIASHLSSPEEEGTRANGLMAIPNAAILAARELEPANAAAARASQPASFGEPSGERFADVFLASPQAKRSSRRRPSSGLRRAHRA